MKKIKVIFTGGTIGSLANYNDISPNGDTKYLLLEKYGKNIERFETSNPLFILSENANINNVLVMAEEIKKAEKEDCKGIILTHGTDTLAYTSAYLSFLLPKISKPVVLVSSDYVLTDSKANGVINFETAVELIDNPKTKPAIYVAYKNCEEQDVNIHLAVRMREPYCNSSCFYSASGYLYAKYVNGKIEYLNTNIERTTKVYQLTPNQSKCGLFIHPFLGLDYNVYKNVNCDFVLHNLYHSGTANTINCNNNTNTNFLDFADYCKAKQIPLYICNINKQDINYNSTNQMLEKDIKTMYNILTNVALAKLYVAYNFISSDQIEDFLSSSICGEIIN